MTDVFISYAHEDQAFVRRMVSALEAEGFSVWWDHTIPPGQSWDTFIAKGIADARCCIVVWSPRSVESDWVKEEATLGKDAGKLVPVSIDSTEPPVGFRRIQAANLTGWSGDKNNGQWQLLVHAARGVVAASRESGAAVRPAYRPPSAPRRAAPVGLIIGAAGIVIAIAVSVAAFVVWRPPTQIASIEETMDADDMKQVAPASDPATAPADQPATETSAAAAANNDEVERLRRERDEAVASAARQRLENARATRAESIVGNWIATGYCESCDAFSISFYENGTWDSAGIGRGGWTARSDGSILFGYPDAQRLPVGNWWIAQRGTQSRAVTGFPGSNTANQPFQLTRRD